MSVPTLPPARSPAAIATKVSPYVNSLGMRFVPVPGAPLFSVWETRVQDFRLFAAEEGEVLERRSGEKRAWDAPGFAQGPTHPVVCVSWHDAGRFGVWLPLRERAAGRLGPRDAYRLPTDAEWTLAAGSALYPWGEEPAERRPRDAGNYLDATAAHAFGWKTAATQDDDGYIYTAPAGSFRANAFGLHDLGGNAWEWGEDTYRAAMNDEEARRQYPGLSNESNSEGVPFRAVRGAAWNYSAAVTLRSTYRGCYVAAHRGGDTGFRVVLEVAER